MSKVANKLIAAAAGAGVEDTGDDNFANVVLLLDGDGTSGDDNNTFTDSSINGYTVTENGSVVQGSFSPYGDNWSVYFDSTAGNQYLQVADSSTFDATTSLCIEAWFYMTTAPGSGPNAHAIVNKWVSTTPGQRTVFIDVEDTGLRVMFDIQGASNPVTIATDGGAISLNEWHHVAVTWDGSTYRAFLDGVLEGSTSNSSAPIASSQVVRVGYNTNAHYFGGYISNVRWVTNGGAIYTSNFTPPTSPLTAISGPALLLNSTNRFVDESSNNHTVTINGTPKVTPFSPFKNSDARDITTDGGSAYFDGVKTTQLYAGTSNVLPATGDFTIEGWVYFTGLNTSNNRSVFFVKDSGTAVSGNRSFQAIFNNNGTKYDDLSIVLFQSNSSFDASTFTHTFEFNEWYHVAVTRTGQTIECFINGTSIGTDTNTKTSINQTTENNYIASWNSSNKDDTHVGYFGDFRIVHSRVYTSNFTPPTSPLTAIANTALLLNFQDAGIYDRTGINNLDTVGNAQIDTAVKKYGTGSIEFDGTGDYIQPVVAASELALGTGDFTIEFWMYPTSVSSTPVAVLSNRYDGSSDNVFQIGFDDGSSRGIHLHTQVTAGINTGVSATANTWQHIAFVRSNGTLSCYKDGTSIGTPTTFTKDLSYAVPPLIGKDGERSPSGTSANFAGYLDGLRITKGVARYTANFTPPTAAHGKF